MKNFFQAQTVDFQAQTVNFLRDENRFSTQGVVSENTLSGRHRPPENITSLVLGQTVEYNKGVVISLRYVFSWVKAPFAINFEKKTTIKAKL